MDPCQFRVRTSAPTSQALPGPGGWRRALARQKQGAKIVVVDPLRTETAEKADVHLAVRPGQDWTLLLGMVKVILDEGLEHRQDCTELATGVGELRRLVADAALDDLASRCDLPRAQIEQVAREDLGLVKPGERVLKLPPSPGQRGR